MDPDFIPDPRIQAITKVELHQHVDGSIPIALIWNLMQKYDLAPCDTIEEMHKLLVMQPEDEGAGLLEYLKKFHYPLWVTQFYENLKEVAYSVARDAYHEGVRTFELRYSPTIHTYAGLTPRQAISSVLQGLNKAEDEFEDLKTGLIVIAMRHMGPHIARICARQAIAEAQQTHRRAGVIGFDIAGAERGNPPHLFKEAYEIAASANLGLTAHAGEDEGPRAVWDAIDVLGCARIGHGCSAVQDKTLLKRMAKDQICVEVCVTSNWQTGAVKKGEPHPVLTFLEYGIPVAICTDNTTVSNTDQGKENTLIHEMGISFEQLEFIHERAETFSFIKPRT